MANRLVVDWFDRLESVLEAEATLSGLLSHGSTVGQAREFLVTRVLRTILPASVHVGCGKVIDSKGNCSRQTDIIIYDPRFPLMEVEGGGLYFVEGVLATIEVKSTIDRAELEASLENCRAVLALAINGEHPEEAAARIAFYAEKGSITQREAEQRFWYMFRPATYVFAFNSKLSFQTTCSYIKEWWNGIGCGYSAHFPLLPRVITAGGVVGFVNDGRFSLGPTTETSRVMSVFSTNLRFRWFALHLMDAVSRRLGLRNFAECFDYRLSEYFPLDDYLAVIKDADTAFIGRAECGQAGGTLS
jgi:hypothetical protein